jgi:release factor glutamine methyltransferase
VTVADALRAGTLRLRAAGVEGAAWDAERLLRHVLDWDRARLVASPGAPLTVEAAGRFEALIAERARRRPLQHLVGTQAFWRHEFAVTPDVLIPRPETEGLVEAALERLRERRSPAIVDVGTGSGCIALSIAAERPDAIVHATELSPGALAVAERNARRLGLEGRVRFHLGDLLEPVAELAGRFDLVLSNPPYADPADAAALPPEVRDHEPAMALFPSGDGYAVYRRLAPQARTALAEDGALLLEIGLGMEAGVRSILEVAGLRVEEVLPDLQGIPRVVIATLSPLPRGEGKG